MTLMRKLFIITGIILILSFIAAIILPRLEKEKEPETYPEEAQANYRLYNSAAALYYADKLELPESKQALAYCMENWDLDGKPEGAVYFVGIEEDPEDDDGEESGESRCIVRMSYLGEEFEWVMTGMED